MFGLGNVFAGLGQILQQVAPVVDAAAGGLGTAVNNGVKMTQTVTSAVVNMTQGNAEAQRQDIKIQVTQTVAAADQQTAQALQPSHPAKSKKGTGKLPPGKAKKGTGDLPPGLAKKGTGDLPPGLAKKGTGDLSPGLANQPSTIASYPLTTVPASGTVPGLDC
jgi:hypothetical protein